MQKESIRDLSEIVEFCPKWAYFHLFSIGQKLLPFDRRPQKKREI